MNTLSDSEAAPEPGAASAYTWNAADYARHSAGQFAWALEIIAKLHLRGDERVLDIGCGDGKVTDLLRQGVPRGQVVGVDRSWGMVALARAAFPALAFAQMDASALGFAPVFDVLFSNATLHWVKDHHAVLAGAARSLRPGGRLLFQMGGAGNAAAVVAVMAHLMTQPAWRAYFTDFTFPYGFYAPDDYLLWLREAGLTPTRAELLPKDMRHADAGAFAGWLRTTWLPYTQRVPAERREAFLAQVLQAYLRGHPADAQGAVHVDMVRLEVEARKPQ